jgi:hypothetical protein
LQPWILTGEQSSLLTHIPPAAARTTKVLGEIFLKNQGFALIDELTRMM